MEDLIRHKCNKCGTVLNLGMFYELGGWFYMPEDEENTFCDCGGEYLPEENDENNEISGL